jgi:hypothetical protein
MYELDESEWKTAEQLQNTLKVHCQPFLEINSRTHIRSGAAELPEARTL